MRLHPPLTKEEALEWLKAEAERADPEVAARPDIEAALDQFAQSMATISGFVLPDTLEPRFP